MSSLHRNSPTANNTISGRTGTTASTSLMKDRNMMTTTSSTGLHTLQEHVRAIQVDKPDWIVSLQDVILPRYVCPPEEPTTVDDVTPLRRNDPPEQARIRALITPVHFPLQHDIRIEVDVDLTTYPDPHAPWPKLWIRSASAQAAALSDDGGMPVHFERHVWKAMQQHGHEERNRLETLLWFFVHRYLSPGNINDPQWPSHVVLPHEIYHHILETWTTADELKKGTQDLDLFKTHEAFGSLDEWLDPQVRDWLYTDQSTFPPFAQEISPNVYTFPMFAPTFCERLAQAFVLEKKYAAEQGIPIRRPNNMNKSGAIMMALGMEPLMDVLQDRVLEPVAKHLFPQTGCEFTDHHSFLVHYEAGHDLGLDMHTDDSDVTYNLCLLKDFSGAKLQVCGIMGEPDHRHSRFAYDHKQGWVICHLGRQRHGADNISSGVRINLINWNHNKTWRRSAEHVASEYRRESGPPDPQCLSYTHDRDWETYKGPRPVETGRKPWCPPPFAQHKSEAPTHPVGD